MLGKIMLAWEISVLTREYQCVWMKDTTLSDGPFAPDRLHCRASNHKMEYKLTRELPRDFGNKEVILKRSYKTRRDFFYHWRETLQWPQQWCCQTGPTNTWTCLSQTGLPPCLTPRASCQPADQQCRWENEGPTAWGAHENYWGALVHSR